MTPMSLSAGLEPIHMTSSELSESLGSLCVSNNIQHKSNPDLVFPCLRSLIHRFSSSNVKSVLSKPGTFFYLRNPEQSTNQSSREIGDVTPPTITLSSRNDRCVRMIAHSLESLKYVGWYWGPLSYDEAERIVEGFLPGSFLLRDSQSLLHLMALTFVNAHGEVKHSHFPENFYKVFPEDILQQCETVQDLVSAALHFSHNKQLRYFTVHDSESLAHSREREDLYEPPEIPQVFDLLYPISRFTCVYSLQHLCRFVILKHCRRDLVVTLPVSCILKQYLLMEQYYIEDVQDFLQCKEVAS